MNSYSKFKVFLEQTAPLIDFYSGRGQLVQINGEQPVAQVTTELRAAVRNALAQ